jgi:hypothetical protein
MPQFPLRNKITGKVEDFVGSYNQYRDFLEKHPELERVYTPPRISVDTQIDPYSESDFVRKTANKRDNIGAFWDRSKELSEKRGGDSSDPVKKKYFDDYAKKRKGRLHLDDSRRQKGITRLSEEK